MLRKRGKYWHVQLKVNGRPWNRSTGETDLRRARLAEKRILEEAQLRRERPRESLSFDRAVVTEVGRIETDISPAAAKRADYCFASFQKWLGRDIDLDKLDTALLEQYQRQRLKQVSLSTVTREIDNIVRLLKENGLAVAKPRRKPGRATQQRPFSDDELVRFFSHCAGEMKTLFLLLLATGARSCEVLPSAYSSHVALLKSEVLPEENAVLIRTAKLRPEEKHKPVKLRKLLVPEPLMERLVAQAAAVPGPHVFRPQPNLHEVFDDICVAAGIATREKAKVQGKFGTEREKVVTHKSDELGRKVTAHSFRHTYATKLAQATGGDQFVLKATLGHAQIRTTDRYCHIGVSQVQVIDLGKLLAEAG